MTRVFAAKDSDTGKHVVIKDCWDPSETVSDEAVHLKLQDPHRKWLDLANEINDHSEWDFADQYENSSPYTDPWDDANCRFLRGVTIMEKYMRPHIRKKGLALFRPLHKHSHKRLKRCTHSL